MAEGGVANYVIVGAGSAGCVLANRLSADPDNSVILIEAGPRDTALSLKIPAAMAANLKSTDHNWAYQGEPEPTLHGRVLQHDRGKGLGGSSSINGMVFIRGHARDFDGWRQMGCPGWGYADVLPYFKRLEDYGGGADDYRGVGGPLNVTRPQAEHPIARAFLKAGEQAGYPVTDDICGFRQEGFGVLDRTTHNGVRWSAARAFLAPVRHRANLKVVTDVRIDRVELTDGRATGVTGVDATGRPVRFGATGEVVLSSGAVGTPQLLMLSGIGPADHLQQVGINVVRDLPGVGANLNEHPDFVLKFSCKQPVSLLNAARGPGKILAGLQWLLSKQGPCATNHFEAVACVRSRAGIDYPDLQLCPIPIAMDEDGWDPLPMHAFQIHVGLMRAYSRGEIRLRGPDPSLAPKILVNYLSDPRDLETMRNGIRLAREIADQPAFADLRGVELFPGPAVQTDDELDAVLRKSVATQWHLTCTAKMGPATDPMAVVDPDGRVHGIDGLRVADASVMPQVTNGNTNAPTLMIAEKLSDAILGKPPLPRAEDPVWEHPNWDTAQR
ncbi:MAG: choline dehydrogenase [Alphaproteobacteria bacterium]